MKVNNERLKDNINTLEKSHDWPVGLVEKLSRFISDGNDYDLFRVNPLQFAEEHHISSSDGIDLFLWATKLNLFQMNWELLCPVCGDHIQSFRHLNTMHDKIFCSLCQCEQTASLDDWIQVTFTVNPKIRAIKFHEPESLSIEDLIFEYHFTRGARIDKQLPFGGEEMVKVIKSLTKGAMFVEPSQKEVIEFDISEGMFKIYDFLNQNCRYLPVSSERPETEQNIDLRYVNNDFEIDQLQLNSGKVKFNLENNSDRRSAFHFSFIPPDIVRRMSQNPDLTIVLDPYLDGKKLLTSQTFRDLFRSEVIQGNEGINVKDLTVLFTDLKGSTELYDKVGDLKAFDLVNSHFESLTKVITKNSGAIVKTIGDAIMATFANPLDAIKAATGIVEDLQEFNQSYGGENIIIKIGVHKGSSIAVTLNDRLDYFGQTVNMAARVQGLADAEEIYITDSIYDVEEVQSEINKYTVLPERTKLKGIEEEVNVYKVLIENVGTPAAV